MRVLRALGAPLLGPVVLSSPGCLYLHSHRILDPHSQDVKPDPENPRISGLARLMSDSSNDLAGRRDPVNAHTGHAANDDVIEIIACGVPAQC